MHNEEFFRTAFIYLCAAAFCVPLARAVGLSAILGYLVAGIAIGPFGIGLIGEEGQDVMHFAEFGVVLMLFLIGLELRPSLLWKLRKAILGLGGLQVVTTTAAITGVGMFAFALPWQTALGIGLSLALSSTAIVLQSLSEKGLMKTRGGQSAFSVLLFQDIAIIPMLALLPLLALHHVPAGATHGGHDAAKGAESSSSFEQWMDGLPGWGNTLLVLAALIAIIIVGRTVVQVLLRVIGRTRVRETFTAFALILVIGASLLMNMFGVSPALGAFLAGVVLATSEYRHQLESDIDPFKGLLLGVFFIAVGAGIDFALVMDKPLLITALVLGLMLLKGVILAAVGWIFRLACDQLLLFTFALAQGGEFAFVLLGFGTQTGVFPEDIAQILVAVVALTMALTPLAMLFEERILRPRMGTREGDDREADAMDEDAPVILAGFGRFGNHIGRFLFAQGVEVTVLDHDSDHIDFIRKVGFKAFYGDASRVELLHAAGADKAKLLIIALRSPEKVEEIVRAAHKHFPNLKVLVRASERTQQYRFLAHENVLSCVHENSHSAVELGVRALCQLGSREYRARRAGLTFLRHEQESVRRLAPVHEDEKSYISGIRERVASLEELFAEDAALSTSRNDNLDRAWNTEGMRGDGEEKPGEE